jgi:hypothetical protein
MRLPGRTSFPKVDDHLVQPEVTRDEMIGGRRVVAMPAKEPHADQHSDLDYVLRAHAAPGYRSSSDLLTRHDVDSDFASDACLRKEGIDPETGTRYLEEIAFEVVSEQNEQVVAEKAPRGSQAEVDELERRWNRHRSKKALDLYGKPVGAGDRRSGAETDGCAGHGS